MVAYTKPQHGKTRKAKRREGSDRVDAENVNAAWKLLNCRPSLKDT